MEDHGRAGVDAGDRLTYVWAAISLIIGVGGGFYVLGGILVLTIARSMNNCWTLLTALETTSA